MTTTLSRAKRLVMTSRKPVGQIIEEQQAKYAKLDERVGHLMTQRVDLEETLAELYEMNRAGRRTP